MHKHCFNLLIGMLAVGLSACPSSQPAANRDPVITSFTVVQVVGASKPTARFLWEISDPDGDPMTCLVTSGAPGDNPSQLPSTLCKTNLGASYAITSDAYPGSGTYTATLRVDDGHGGKASASTTVTLK